MLTITGARWETDMVVEQLAAGECEYCPVVRQCGNMSAHNALSADSDGETAGISCGGIIRRYVKIVNTEE